MLLLAVSCGGNDGLAPTSSASNGDLPTADIASTGSGGAPAIPNPATVSSPEACVHPGPDHGGAYLRPCTALNIQFVPPLRGTLHEIQVTTDSGGGPIVAGASTSFQSGNKNGILDAEKW